MEIKEVEKVIKEVLGNADILNTENVYEKIKGSDNLKLVIFFNKLFHQKHSVLYTKLIFVTNPSKTEIVQNSFLYLYDINCIYNNVDFTDTTDLKNRLKNIFQKELFGPNLKVLTQFIEKPSFLINEWLKENKIPEINVTNVQYKPKMFILPCKSLFFSFLLSVNNTEVELTITKEGENQFNLAFNILNNIINIEKSNLKSLIQTIGETLKNNIKL